MSTKDDLLFLLKTRGPQTTAQLAERTGITKMGVRQHLESVQEEGLVEFQFEKGKVGRPAQVWELTEEGHGRFPETHGELTADLLGLIREAFGKSGMDKINRLRTGKLKEIYAQLTEAKAPLEKRVKELAKRRDREGYMATSRKNRDGSFLLIENHCPICVAARACQGLCDGELELFRDVLFDADVERAEHIVSGDRRCVYKITPRK